MISVVLMVVLFASPALGWDGRFPCVSQALDLGACETYGGWMRPEKRRVYEPWTIGNRLVATAAVVGLAGDAATTIYGLTADRCGGRIGEANPLVPSIPLLLAWKAGTWLAAWVIGDSFGGAHRDATWGSVAIFNLGVTAWNIKIIGDNCT